VHPRIAAFAEAITGAGMVAALVMHTVDVYYLAGTGQPANLLVVPGEEPVLFARRFGELVREQTWVERVLDGAGFTAVAREAERLGLGHGPLGMELDVLPVALVARAEQAFPRRTVVDCSPQLLAQRAVKDADEVEAMRAAAGLFEAVHGAIVASLRPGISELELSAEVSRALRAAGHEGIVRQRRWDARLPIEGSLVSGDNLAIISGGPITVTGVGLGSAYPMGASTRRIAEGDLVNIDLGMNLAGYHGDMARTYALGEVPAPAASYATAVRELQDAIIAAVRPGIPASAIYDAGLEAARELGVEDVFQGYDGVHGPYVGHSIGLELDEPPVLGPGVATTIEEGMVLAVEPKLISPAFGAVNLEDDVVVTADGCELLGAVPRSVFVVDGRGGAVPVTG
jgi:Xaa-Pro aminopeptidase